MFFGTASHITQGSQLPRHKPERRYYLVGQTEWILILALYLSSTVTLGKLLTKRKKQDTDSRDTEGKWTGRVVDWLCKKNSQM